MSYTKSLAAFAGAAALSAQMATAAPQDAEIIQVQGFQSMQVQRQQTIIPAEIRPFIGDLDVNVNLNVDFENGIIKTDSVDIDVSNIACDILGPMFEALDAQDLAENARWGMERSEEEQMLVDSLRELFTDRVLDFSETVTPEMALQSLEIAGLVGAQLPADFPEESRFSVHLECAGYEAPAPTFTPVEPN